MRLLPWGIALVAVVFYAVNLGAAPYFDGPEGFHVEIAREMVRDGNWITPRLDGIRYFDKPPVLYWVLVPFLRIGGGTPFVTRLPSVLAAAACAAVTARLGILLGGARVGLLAGLMTVANMAIFIHGRLVKPGHYGLPAFPALALLTARLWDDALARRPDSPGVRRSVQPITEALRSRWHPGDLVIHEGPLENSASVLLALETRMPIANGVCSNLAFGATFLEAHEMFWDTTRLRTEWSSRERRFLISLEHPRRSVVGALPAGTVHVIAETDGRRLYSNRPDDRPV